MYVVMIFAIIGITIVFSLKVISTAELRKLEQQGAEETMKRKFELDMGKEKTMQDAINLEGKRIQYKCDYSAEYKEGIRNYW